MRILRQVKKEKRRPSSPFKTIRNTVPNAGPPIASCVAHRCAAHEDVKPLNLNTPEGTECAACIAADLGEMMTIYNDMRDRLERACGALNLLSPGAGDSFLPPPVTETENPIDDDRATDEAAATSADPQHDEASAVQADGPGKTRTRD